MAKRLPSVDVSEQAALGTAVPPEREAASEVFDMIKECADFLVQRGGPKRGALIVIGRFSSIGEVAGARFLGPNPFEGQYVSAGDKAFQRMILTEEELGDGACIVDASGQVLGGRIYLIIDHPEVDIPDGSFTRHLAAASTSMRKEVEAVITLSEETNVARVFQGGRVVEVYDPNENPEEAEDEDAEDTASTDGARRKKHSKRRAKKAPEDPAPKECEEPKNDKECAQ